MPILRRRPTLPITLLSLCRKLAKPAAVSPGDRPPIVNRPFPSILTPFSSDWALLSSELQFIYLDPVLASHLEDQAELLVGKSLLSFVHPDEQASAKVDLGGVLDSRTLHGSVTRYVPSFPTPA